MNFSIGGQAAGSRDAPLIGLWEKMTEERAWGNSFLRGDILYSAPQINVAAARKQTNSNVVSKQTNSRFQSFFRDFIHGSVIASHNEERPLLPTTKVWTSVFLAEVVAAEADARRKCDNINGRSNNWNKMGLDLIKKKTLVCLCVIIKMSNLRIAGDKDKSMIYRRSLQSPPYFWHSFSGFWRIVTGKLRFSLPICRSDLTIESDWDCYFYCEKIWPTQSISPLIDWYW